MKAVAVICVLASLAGVSATVFGAADVPVCHVDQAGRTVVHYSDDHPLHISFLCSHVGSSCTCKKHPTHHGGKCRQFHHTDGSKHDLGGDCTDTGVDNVGVTEGAQCPDGTRTASKFGCYFQGRPKSGGRSRNVFSFSPSWFKVLKGQYLQVTASCRQGWCGASLRSFRLDVGSNYGSCSGQGCGNNALSLCGWKFPAPANSRIGPWGYNPGYPWQGNGQPTTWGPFTADTQLKSTGQAFQGSCAENLIADSYGHYKTAECFQDSHCGSGKACSNNKCISTPNPTPAPTPKPVRRCPQRQVFSLRNSAGDPAACKVFTNSRGPGSIATCQCMGNGASKTMKCVNGSWQTHSQGNIRFCARCDSGSEGCRA